MKVLQVLVSRPGEIVTREELRRHVWGDTRFVEFDRGLNFCVATVRGALNDNARSARFIETVPRRGYRFVADVKRTEDGGRRTSGEIRRRWLSVAAIVPLLLQTAP